MGEVLHLLREGVREPREAAHPHPHGEVLALDVAGRDQRLVRLSADDPLVDAGADGGAVTALALDAALVPVELVEHGEVDAVRTEQRLHDGEVGTVTIGGHLHAAPKAALEVAQEHVGVGRGALAHEPRRDELRVSVDRDPRPHVPVAELALVLGSDVLLLAVAERPDFVALDPLGGQVGEHAVLILGARLAHLDQKFDDGVLRHAGHATVARMLLPSTRRQRPALGAQRRIGSY